MKIAPANGHLSRIPSKRQNGSNLPPVEDLNFGRLKGSDLNPPKKIETDTRAAKFERVKELHTEFCQATYRAIQIVLEAGKILAGLRATARHGEWELELSRIGLPCNTAWRYMQVFERCKSRADSKQLLESGGDLCELYRELGIIRAREGGGHRSPKWKKGQQQMFFHFDILDDELRVAELKKWTPLDSVEREKLQDHLERLERYAEAIRERLGETIEA